MNSLNVAHVMQLIAMAIIGAIAVGAMAALWAGIVSSMMKGH